MRRLLIFALLASVTGCGLADRVGLWGKVRGDRDQPYMAVLSSGDDPRAFAVTVRDAAGASVDDIRESTRLPATRYCIDRYGASDVAWDTDPQTGDWETRRDGADLIFSGRCTAR